MIVVEPIKEAIKYSFHLFFCFCSAFEERIGQLKTSIVEKNSLLSQSIAHFQKVRIQSQGGQSVTTVTGGDTGAVVTAPNRMKEVASISGGECS